ncbi:MAG: NADH-quinone oxidoreductase subunit NuoH [Bacteroidetes bacterium]|nr:NADH-quinone oxidoreductase subunit NuoH [Bacteroidota bacterium]
MNALLLSWLQADVATLLVEKLIFAGIVVFVMLTTAAYTVYAERKVAAFIQQRPGPNRVGPLGLLQPAADAVKLILKEDIVPSDSSKFLHFLAPVITVTLAVLGLAMMPFAKGLILFDANIGILFVLGVASIAVYGVTLAGWASNSKYALLGGLRSSAQMISYELSMGLSVISVILLTNQFFAGDEFLRITSIVEAQRDAWFFLLNPIGFFIFVITAFAETNRTPFDLVEAEQELVGGFHTEYSGMKFGAFFVGEYLSVVVMSGLITTLFFGGYLGPFEETLGVAGWSPLWITLWGIAWFGAKTLFWVFIFLWVRWTLPRFKYNQLMSLGWKRTLPIALVNLMLIAALLSFGAYDWLK